MKRIRQSNIFQSTAQKTAAEIDEIRERCGSFFGFVKEAWPHVPGLANVEYIEGWHIPFVGYHLAAISYGWTLERNLPNRLLINIPPAMMKSLLVSVFWPSWEWTTNPAHQYIVTSYREENCKRDTARMCGLVMSDWYQMLWGEDRKQPDGTIIPGVKMVATGETKISNTAGGWREGIPFGSLTGNRADRVILDDPHSVDTAESDAQRNKTTMRFRESVTSRLNDPIKSAIVVVMQRLHVNDISGVIEELRLPYVKVVLPMEFEKARRCVTPFGAMDHRQQEGELLFPERFPKEVVERDKRSLGEIAVAGQFQQRPIPRGGLMFKANWFEATVPEVPANCRYVRHWDLAALKPHAGSSYGQAWTAGVKLGRAPNGVYYIVHVDRLQGDGNAVRRRSS
jgi:hypothetical protein